MGIAKNPWFEVQETLACFSDKQKTARRILVKFMNEAPLKKQESDVDQNLPLADKRSGSKELAFSPKELSDKLGVSTSAIYENLRTGRGRLDSAYFLKNL